jgi:hypothetical protein
MREHRGGADHSKERDEREESTQQKSVHRRSPCRLAEPCRALAACSVGEDVLAGQTILADAKVRLLQVFFATGLLAIRTAFARVAIWLVHLLSRGERRRGSRVSTKKLSSW